MTVSLSALGHDLRHLPGTEGAELVETPTMKAARVSFELLKRGSGIVAVDGPSGRGKTFAADALAREFSHRVYWLDLTGQRSISTMYARLWYKISGLHSTSRTAYTIAMDIHDVLVEADCVLLVDEAQWANRGLLRTLRSIYDAVSNTRNPHTFGLVLIGQRLRRVLQDKEPGLHSRTSRWVSANALDRRTIGGILTEYHPLFGATDPAVIAEVLWPGCRGNWRRWAHVLEAALMLGCDGDSGITKGDARAVVGMLGVGEADVA